MSAGVNGYMQLFSMTSWSCGNIYYCDFCHHSKNLFGCIGLGKKNQYCILNKQYSQEDYEKCCREVAESMVKNDEWGRFFPTTLSPHGYNESAAQEFFPLSEGEATKRGFNWSEPKEEMDSMHSSIKRSDPSEKIESVTDAILSTAITCEVTGKPFRIIKQELEFYRVMNLPLPSVHPDERHRRRMALRNPRKLWGRACGKCEKEIQTTYSPERPEIVYCEACYLAEVY
jgi:hypothetical protein